jgi:excisionase family DNA binding protein
MGHRPQVANSIAETCERLSIGRTTLHSLINQGRLKAFKLGSKTLIPESEIERLVEEQLSARGGQAGSA